MGGRAPSAVTSPRLRPTLIGIVAALTTVVLVGCGSEQTDDQADAPSDSAAAATASPTSSDPHASPTPSTTPPAPSPSTATSAPPTSSSPSPASGRITIVDFEYRGDMRASPGQRVRVTNKDNTAHTLTAAAGDSVFDVTIAPGETATFTAPKRSGSYGYVCKFHATMTGTLVVG